MATVILEASVALFAIVTGLWAFAQFSGGASALVSVLGLLRNVALAIVGVMLIISGMWPLIILGGVFLALAVYLGSYHGDNLTGGTTFRRRLLG